MGQHLFQPRHQELGADKAKPQCQSCDPVLKYYFLVEGCAAVSTAGLGEVLDVPWGPRQDWHFDAGVKLSQLASLPNWSTWTGL